MDHVRVAIIGSGPAGLTAAANGALTQVIVAAGTYVEDLSFASGISIR